MVKHFGEGKRFNGITNDARYLFFVDPPPPLFYALAQLVEALRYKWEGRGFDSRWCRWNFSLT